MPRKPNFVDAFLPVIYMWGFYGNDVNPRPVQTMLRRMFFACVFLIHAAISSYLMWFAAASAELDPNKIEIMATSFGRLVIASDDLFFKFAFFFTARSVTIAIVKIDALFKRFNGNEIKFLQKLTSVCKWIRLYPIIGLIFHFVEVAEQMIQPNGRKMIGSPEFKHLIQTNPHLYYLVYFLAVPLGYFQMGLIGVFLFILMWTLMHIFDELADPTKVCPDTQARKYIKRRQTANITNFLSIHREASEVLRCVNRAFQWYLLEWLMMQMLHSLILARQVYHNKKVVPTIIPMLATVLTIAIIQIHIYAKVNIKAKNCLNRCIGMGLEMEYAYQQALGAKIELYATHYQLDAPGITAGGMVTFSRYLIVAFIDFVFSYNVYLQGKHDAENQLGNGTSAALVSHKAITMEVRISN